MRTGTLLVALCVGFATPGCKKNPQAPSAAELTGIQHAFDRLADPPSIDGYKILELFVSMPAASPPDVNLGYSPACGAALRTATASISDHKPVAQFDQVISLCKFQCPNDWSAIAAKPLAERWSAVNVACGDDPLVSPPNVREPQIRSVEAYVIIRNVVPAFDARLRSYNSPPAEAERKRLVLLVANMYRAIHTSDNFTRIDELRAFVESQADATVAVTPPSLAPPAVVFDAGPATVLPLRANPPVVHGLLSPEAIRRVVLRNLGSLRTCQNGRSEQAVGGVTVHFRLGSRGTVSEARVAARDPSVSEAVAQCMASAIGKLQFPEPPDESTTVDYPFTLNMPHAFQ